MDAAIACLLFLAASCGPSSTGTGQPPTTTASAAGPTTSTSTSAAETGTTAATTVTATTAASSTSAPATTLAPADATVFPGIWPFASAAELDAYAGGSDQRFRDPTRTATEFARLYLGIEQPAVFPFVADGPTAGRVGLGFQLGEGGAPVTPTQTMEAEVRQLGPTGPDGPWTVVAVTAPTIVVESPRAAEQIASPLRVRGRASSYEGTIHVVVREDSGRGEADPGPVTGPSLGTDFVTGSGSAEPGPFDGTVGFESPTRRTGAVTFLAPSAATGGSILAATVVRVGFQPTS